MCVGRCECVVCGCVYGWVGVCMGGWVGVSVLCVGVYVVLVFCVYVRVLCVGVCMSCLYFVCMLMCDAVL